MNPIIKKLQTNYPELPLVESELSWEKIDFLSNKSLWTKLVDDHLLLNLDFSCLCQQIKKQIKVLNATNFVDIENLKEQLLAAILFARLLEHLYDEKHLNVAREVGRLRALRMTYSQILSPQKEGLENPELYLPFNELINNWLIKAREDPMKFSAICLSFVALIENWVGGLVLAFKNGIINLFTAQGVRTATFESNLYRLLSVRSRRFLEMIQLAGLGSKSYAKVIEVLNQYAVPFFTWLAWIFFLPRLLVSCFVLLKNTFYTADLSEEQRALGYFARFMTQFKRRWFHLGNDLVWATMGLLNCFLFVGALSPIGAYLTVAAFIYDVVLAIINVSIELYRLTGLRNQYEQMEQTLEIKRHLEAIDERIEFEAFRLGINVLSTIAIALAASLALPLFASAPFIPLVGALLLVIISLVAFASNAVIEKSRPKDSLDEKEIGPLQSKIGFFAPQKPARPNLDLEISLEPCASQCYAY